MAEFTLGFEDKDNLSSIHEDCNYTAYPLSVPQDNIEEIMELYPNFADDSISLAGLDFSPTSSQEFETQETTRVMLRKRVALQDCCGFGNKRPRGRREGRRAAWAMNEVSFGAENEEPERRGAAWAVNGVSFGTENEELGRRRCSHCQTTQTPQWRIGPLGPKTLCNACGVRYKSGRLLPEYRPAASPTFDSHKHSNFHRKILKKKEKGLFG